MNWILDEFMQNDGVVIRKIFTIYYYTKPQSPIPYSMTKYYFAILYARPSYAASSNILSRFTNDTETDSTPSVGMLQTWSSVQCNEMCAHCAVREVVR